MTHCPRSATSDLPLTEMVESGHARRIVISSVGSKVRASGLDADDIVQEALVGILEAQRRERSRYHSGRGYSPSTYVCMVGRCAALNAMRAPIRRRTREVVDSEADSVVQAQEGTAEGALRRILDVLDLPEEREMAVHLAAGCTLSEIRTRMGLSERAASDLRLRVRALLLPLREG